jgi:WD40 repeat protein
VTPNTLLQLPTHTRACIHQHQTLDAKSIYMAHSGVIEDVAWHQHHTDIFGSVGDDKQLILWDTRKPPREGEGPWLHVRRCVWGAGAGVCLQPPVTVVVSSTPACLACARADMPACLACARADMTLRCHGGV